MKRKRSVLVAMAATLAALCNGTATKNSADQQSSIMRFLQAGTFDLDACMNFSTMQAKLRLLEFTDYIMSIVTVDLLEYPKERQDLGGSSLDVSALAEVFLQGGDTFVDQYYLNYPEWIPIVPSAVMSTYVNYACNATFINTLDGNANDLASFCTIYAQGKSNYTAINDYPADAAIVFENITNTEKVIQVSLELCNSISDSYSEITANMIHAYDNLGWVTMIQGSNEVTTEQTIQTTDTVDTAFSATAPVDFESTCINSLKNESGTFLQLSEYIEYIFVAATKMDLLKRDLEIPKVLHTNVDLLRRMLLDPSSFNYVSLEELLALESSSSLESLPLIEIFTSRSCQTMSTTDMSSEAMAYCQDYSPETNVAPMDLAIPIQNNNNLDTIVSELCYATVEQWGDVIQSLDLLYAPLLDQFALEHMLLFNKTFSVQTSAKLSVEEVSLTVVEDLHWNIKRILFRMNDELARRKLSQRHAQETSSASLISIQINSLSKFDCSVYLCMDFEATFILEPGGIEQDLVRDTLALEALPTADTSGDVRFYNSRQDLENSLNVSGMRESTKSPKSTSALVGGIVVGCLSVVAVLIALGVFMLKRRRQADHEKLLNSESISVFNTPPITPENNVEDGGLVPKRSQNHKFFDFKDERSPQSYCVEIVASRSNSTDGGEAFSLEEVVDERTFERNASTKEPEFNLGNLMGSVCGADFDDEKSHQSKANLDDVVSVKSSHTEYEMVLSKNETPASKFDIANIEEDALSRSIGPTPSKGEETCTTNSSHRPQRATKDMIDDWSVDLSQGQTQVQNLHESAAIPSTLIANPKVTIINEPESTPKIKSLEDKSTHNVELEDMEEPGALVLRKTPIQRPRLWATAIDHASGDVYFYNTITKETTWDRPASFDSTDDPNREALHANSEEANQVKQEVVKTLSSDQEEDDEPGPLPTVKQRTEPIVAKAFPLLETQSSLSYMSKGTQVISNVSSRNVANIHHHARSGMDESESTPASVPLKQVMSNITSFSNAPTDPISNKADSRAMVGAAMSLSNRYQNRERVRTPSPTPPSIKSESEASAEGDSFYDDSSVSDLSGFTDEESAKGATARLNRRELEARMDQLERAVVAQNWELAEETVAGLEKLMGSNNGRRLTKSGRNSSKEYSAKYANMDHEELQGELENMMDNNDWTGVAMVIRAFRNNSENDLVESSPYKKEKKGYKFGKIRGNKSKASHDRVQKPAKALGARSRLQSSDSDGESSESSYNSSSEETDSKYVLGYQKNKFIA